MIDLHMHSTFSDGTFTPEELVSEAVRRGLRAIALTDHDTIAGLGRFLAAGKRQNLPCATGVEISVDFPGGALHMLGYLIDPEGPALHKELRWIRTGREMRNRELLSKLNELGFKVSWEEVLSQAGEDVVGRPHFAQALIRKGVVKDKEEAFERLLAQGRPAYVDRPRFAVEKSIEVIRSAGGVPVLAHPFALNLDRAALRTYLLSWREAGLGGLEVYYPEHDEAAQASYLELAEEAGLVATGGSDFHGALSPGVTMGSGTGDLRVPDEVLQQLEAARNL